MLLNDSSLQSQSIPKSPSRPLKKKKTCLPLASFEHWLSLSTCRFSRRSAYCCKPLQTVADHKALLPITTRNPTPAVLQHVDVWPVVDHGKIPRALSARRPGDSPERPHPTRAQLECLQEGSLTKILWGKPAGGPLKHRCRQRSKLDQLPFESGHNTTAQQFGELVCSTGQATK